MNGVEDRDFDTAFYGVFGEAPSTLYRRYVAEFTYKAMQKEIEEAPLDSKVWQEYEYTAFDPVLSKEGNMLAIVERDKKGRMHLNVYDTQDDPTVQAQFEEKRRAIIEADPLDIADIPPKAFAKKRLHRLKPTNFSGMRYPQWCADNVLYFVATVKDEHHRRARRGELFSWSLETGTVKQLSTGLAIRRFALTQDCQTVFAEQVRYGYSELVRVDIATGHVEPLFEPQLSTLYDHPILHERQEKLAFLKHTINQDWRLYIQDLKSQEVITVPMPEGYQYATQPSLVQKWQIRVFYCRKSRKCRHLSL